VRTGPVPILLMSLLLCGCRRNDSRCAKLDIRLDNVIGITERHLREVEMREFLWTHWHERKCATILLKSVSKEGKKSDTSYEIKFLPAATPVMIVTVNQARYGYLGQVVWRQVAKFDVYAVERIQPSNSCLLNANSTVEVLPDTLPLTGSDYCLRFKGWNNEVESFF